MLSATYYADANNISATLKFQFQPAIKAKIIQAAFSAAGSLI